MVCEIKETCQHNSHDETPEFTGIYTHHKFSSQRVLDILLTGTGLTVVFLRFTYNK